MTEEGGLVGDWKPGANTFGGELAHLSTCSGFTGVVTGLEGRFLLWLVLSMGVVEPVLVSEAAEGGLFALLLPPGEEAVAVLFSEEEPGLFCDAAAAFSAFLHLALLF